MKAADREICENTKEIIINKRILTSFLLRCVQQFGPKNLIFHQIVIARSIKKHQNKNNCVQLYRIYMVIFNCTKIVPLFVFNLFKYDY